MTVSNGDITIFIAPDLEGAARANGMKYEIVQTMPYGNWRIQDTSRSDINVAWIHGCFEDGRIAARHA